MITGKAPFQYTLAGRSLCIKNMQNNEGIIFAEAPDHVTRLNPHLFDYEPALTQLI